MGCRKFQADQIDGFVCMNGVTSLPSSTFHRCQSTVVGGGKARLLVKDWFVCGSNSSTLFFYLVQIKLSFSLRAQT